MIEIAFTEKNIQRAIAYKDMINDVRFRDVVHREAIAAATFKKIESGRVFNGGLKVSEINGKRTFQFENIEQELCCRLLVKNIRANYLIKVTNRQNTIKNTISFLKESSPYSVYRFDIVKFFESVDRVALLNKILLEGNCSRQTTLLLTAFFDLLTRQNIEGLPRGVGISSVLAELIMLSFDQSLREKHDVFFYARYVDDILIVGSNLTTKSVIQNFVDEKLPPPLIIHKKGPKVASFTIGKVSGRDSGPNIFEYLGYKFSIYSKAHPTELVLGVTRRKVLVEISDSKIIKLKNRLVDSFASYMSGSSGVGDFQLLKNRIKALTGNYSITDPLSGVPIKTGVYFNYTEKNDFNKCELHGLDNFFRGLLYCKAHHLSQRIQIKLSSAQRSELTGFGFVAGFHRKTFYSFSFLELRKIKNGWKR